MTDLKKLMDLSGKRAVVTGGAGHLGRAFAATLAELGAAVALVDRNSDALDTAVEEVSQKYGAMASGYTCDLEQEAERDRLIEALLKDGPVDILVNNAAFVGSSDLTGWSTDFENQSIDTWRRAMEVNVTAAFHLCQKLAPTMRKQSGASIINIASIYGQWGPDWSLYEGTQLANPAAYGASKGGLIQLSRWLATTLAPDIRVNAISPGGISRGQPASFVEKYEQRVPLGRMAEEDDFRGALAFLASDMSKYVTGQILAVDGGWGAW